MYKSIVSAVLTASVLMSGATFAKGSDAAVISEWAENEITTASQLNLIPRKLGIEDYTQNIRRDKFCELAMQLMNVMKVDTKSGADNPFTDTDNADVIKLTQMGIIEGKGDRRFAPEDSITREEAAAILYRMAEYVKLAMPEINDVEYYHDEAQISEWAHNAVLTMREMQVMRGVNDYEFMPKGNYTVEQAAVTMLRLYNYNANIHPVSKNEMNYERTGHQTVTVGNKVYAIGGTDDANNLMNSIEMCWENTNKWIFECSSDNILADETAAADDSTIYLIGGTENNQCTDTVRAYNTKEKEWSEVGRVAKPVKKGRGVYGNGKLYIAGGKNDADQDVYFIQIYDLKTNQTTEIEYPEELSNVQPLLYKDTLYIFGSVQDENNNYTTMSYAYINGAWEKKAAAQEYSTFAGGQTDGELFYFAAYKQNSVDILSYDPAKDEWRVIMDGYIRDRSAFGFSLCGGYAYITGGISVKNLAVNRLSEPYYYQFTHADYDPDSVVGFKQTFGFDYDNSGKTFDVIPEIKSVNVRVLDSEKGVYELSMPKETYECDENADPYFFWTVYVGNIDGHNTNYSRVIYHADPDAPETVRITVGMGDGSGFTDKKSFNITK